MNKLSISTVHLQRGRRFGHVLRPVWVSTTQKDGPNAGELPGGS
jgi:hypothetical protein